MIRGVVFDLDGVLVSTDELHFRGWKMLADEHQIYFDRQINHRLRGVSRMASLEIILERSDKQYSDEEKAAMAQRKNDYYRALLEDLTPDDALPGAREMLQELGRRGINTAIASASRNAPTIVRKVALDGLIDVMVDGNDTTRSKPDPQVFLLAAEKLGLAPQECIVVEDAQAGIDGAKAAKMAALGIGPPGSLTGADRMAASLADITPDELLATGQEQ